MSRKFKFLTLGAVLLLVTVFKNVESSHAIPSKRSSRRETTERFTSNVEDILVEHTDFVILRLQHISQASPSNIKELMALQKAEMAQNQIYKSTWDIASELFYTEMKERIYKDYANDSAVQTVSDKLHIAIIAYTLDKIGDDKSLYQDFNHMTREVCSGHDIQNYGYKSYFKLLELAIDTLSKDMKMSNPLLFRGVLNRFNVKEGKDIAFQHFLSTSGRRDIAEEFASGQTLFAVHGDHNLRAIDLNRHSVYPSENAVLFSHLHLYKVELVKFNGARGYTEVTLSGQRSLPSWVGDSGLSDILRASGSSSVVTLLVAGAYIRLKKKKEQDVINEGEV